MAPAPGRVPDMLAIVIGALILGFLAGAVARLLMPDVFSSMRGWRSWALSTVLGLAGAALGWLIFTKLLGIGDEDVFDLGGIIGAIIGTMILLGIVGFVMRRTGAPRQTTIGEAQRSAARGERSAARERRRDRPR